jgi:hypothetical protein
MGRVRVALLLIGEDSVKSVSRLSVCFFEMVTGSAKIEMLSFDPLAVWPTAICSV